ncbi:hypothetical protein BGZ83_010722, partial [Gryganskiella cystojenkinii]
YLDAPTIAACLSVSQSWHAAFLPRFWSAIEVKVTSKSMEPSFDLIQKYTSLIRKIHISADNSLDTPDGSSIYCPNLTTLIIKQNGDNNDNSHIAFIRRHKDTLTSLSVDRITSNDLLEAVIACPRLQKLDLPILWLTDPKLWMRLHEHLWSRLSVLSLCGPWIAPSLMNKLPSLDTMAAAQVAARTGPARVLDLTLGGCDPSDEDTHAQIWFIQQCPNLVRLRWDSHFTLSAVKNQYPHINALSPMHALVEALVTVAHPEETSSSSSLSYPSRSLSWSCESLRTLAIPRIRFDSKDFAILTEKISGLEELDLSGTNFNSDCWEALLTTRRHHLQTLRVLQLANCPHLKGSDIQGMMCSLPNLQVFKAGVVSSVDIQSDGRSWACRELKELCVEFALETPRRLSRSPPHSSETLVFSRLSDLTKLEVCELRGSSNNTAPRLTLKNGLDLLRSLRQMREFTNNSIHRVQWGEPEMRWVLEHWPRWQVIEGISLDKEARRLLKKHIKTLQ